jgi:DDE superfamily endonuclease
MTIPPRDQERRHELEGFRGELYRSFSGWGDALFELADAVPCAPSPVASVPALSLEPVFRRSHGSLYKALERGGIDEGRLRCLLVEHRPVDWPLVFAVDASTWDRCDAECSPERGYYYSASKKGTSPSSTRSSTRRRICSTVAVTGSRKDVMRSTSSGAVHESEAQSSWQIH